MKLPFYNDFHKLRSGASQMTIIDFPPTMQNLSFALISHLASTRASLRRISWYVKMYSTRGVFEIENVNVHSKMYMFHCVLLSDAFLLILSIFHVVFYITYSDSCIMFTYDVPDGHAWPTSSSCIASGGLGSPQGQSGGVGPDSTMYLMPRCSYDKWPAGEHLIMYGCFRSRRSTKRSNRPG